MNVVTNSATCCRPWRRIHLPRWSRLRPDLPPAAFRNCPTPVDKRAMYRRVTINHTETQMTPSKQQRAAYKSAIDAVYSLVN
jgi:hypothetical protein